MASFFLIFNKQRVNFLSDRLTAALIFMYVFYISTFIFRFWYGLLPNSVPKIHKNQNIITVRFVDKVMQFLEF